MDRYLKAAIICFTIAGLALWAFVSCVPVKFHRAVVLERVHIVVVSSDRKDGMALKEKGQSTIIVTGRMIDGVIYVDRDVLAHEMMHLLRWQDPVFRDPDGG